MSAVGAVIASAAANPPRCASASRFSHADGHYVWLGAQIRPVHDVSGTVVARLGNLRDVTREVQARQLALAIRDEVCDLEAAGIRIIQIDEQAADLLQRRALLHPGL